ncbi:MAG TPA: hypothetical protein VFN09_15690, partial [Rhodanobacteraceae bacterium]|nr:hypothetical protein [Rhodanobacteraceae bacterium]
MSKPPRRGRLGTVGRNVLGWLAMTLFGALSTHAAEPPRAQSAALTSYQRDLVSILVLRDDATHLLGAALLARTLDQQPPGLDSASLLARADKAPDHGLLPTWIELSQCEAPADCPNPTALAALQAADPDNAAVWLLGLGRAARQHDAAGEQAMLAKAAAASRYDDYAGATLKTLVAAATALPVPKDVLAAYAGKTAAGPASAQAFLAFGSVGLHPRPGLLPLAALCAPDHDAAATLRADCLQLSTRLIWGSSPQARAAGLHLRETLSEDAATRRDA